MIKAAVIMGLCCVKGGDNGCCSELVEEAGKGGISFDGTMIFVGSTMKNDGAFSWEQ